MIVFLVKFLSEEAHVLDLLDGKIYARRVAWFRDVEESDDLGRGDRHEGAIGWHQLDRVNLTINGVNMTPDLGGPVEIHSDQLDHLNIYCTYAARIKDEVLNSLVDTDSDELRSLLAIPSSCHSLGQYAVMIKDVPGFIHRVGEAAQAEGYRMWHGHMKYYDPDTYHSSNFGIDALFWKQQRHSYQSEFRLVIDTHTESDEPITLGIGDMRDIALQFRTVELNEELLGI